jgi:hypothetical protein
MAWSGLGLLSSIGGRWQLRKVALTTQFMLPDTNFPPSELGRISEKSDGRSLCVMKDGLPIRYGKVKESEGPRATTAVGLVPGYVLAEGVEIEVLSPMTCLTFSAHRGSRA